MVKSEMISRSGAVKAAATVVAVLFLTFTLWVLVAGAADQLLLDWETDINGNPLQSGQVIDDEFHNTNGISLTIKAVSDRPDGSNVRAIFPSYEPPVNASGITIDPDLGSPNVTCPGGGPGIGAGGEVGQPGENCGELGNVLIIPTVGDENGDGFIDGLPDDDAAGGLATFIFSEPVTVDYLELVDLNDNETAIISAYSAASGGTENLIVEASGLPLGDNSFQRVALNAANVVRLDVDYLGSGALATLAFTPSDPNSVALLGATASAATPTVWLLAFATLLAGLSVLLLSRLSSALPIRVRRRH